MPPATHPALNPDESERWQELRATWAAIAPMYWDPRMTPEDATEVIRGFLEALPAADART